MHFYDELKFMSCNLSISCYLYTLLWSYMGYITYNLYETDVIISFQVYSRVFPRHSSLIILRFMSFQGRFLFIVPESVLVLTKSHQRFNASFNVRFNC